MNLRRWIVFTVAAATFAGLLGGRAANESVSSLNYGPATATTTSTTSANQENNGESVTSAVFGLVGALVGATLGAIGSYIAAKKTADSQLASARIAAQSAISAALQSGESSLQVAMEQIRAASVSHQIAQLDEISLHRRERQEGVLRDLSKVISTLAIAVHAFTRGRTQAVAAGESWQSATERLDQSLAKARIETYSLLQQLPRDKNGDPSGPWNLAWSEVIQLAEQNVEDVLQAADLGKQSGAEESLNGGVIAAQNAIGKAFDYLDTEIVRQLGETRTALEAGVPKSPEPSD
jgi:hypothetical protein